MSLPDLLSFVRRQLIWSYHAHTKHATSYGVLHNIGVDRASGQGTVVYGTVVSTNTAYTHNYRHYS